MRTGKPALYGAPSTYDVTVPKFTFHHCTDDMLILAKFVGLRCSAGVAETLQKNGVDIWSNSLLEKLANIKLDE